MREPERRTRGDLSSVSKQAQVGLESDPAQSKYGSGMKQLELAFKIACTVCELARKRFVVGRSTANRGGDVGVLQRQTVVPMRRGWLAGESRTVKLAI